MPNARFRPALPSDRQQIRLLVGCYYNYHSQPNGFQSWQQPRQRFSLTLVLVLCGLLALGGLQLLLGALCFTVTIAAACWLDRWLFSDWRHYWVIEQNNCLIACARLTCYGTDAILSDVVVSPKHRQQGIGTLLLINICQLNSQLNQSIYLTCAPSLVKFYQRFGFEIVNTNLLPSQLKRELGLDTELLALKRTQRPQCSPLSSKSRT